MIQLLVKKEDNSHEELCWRRDSKSIIEASWRANHDDSRWVNLEGVPKEQRMKMFYLRMDPSSSPLLWLLARLEKIVKSVVDGVVSLKGLPGLELQVRNFLHLGIQVTLVIY